MGLALRVAALVCFIIACLAVWFTTTSLDDVVSIVSLGLGAWVASTLWVDHTV